VSDSRNSEERLAFERKLLSRFKRGDSRAFAELYQAYSGPLYRQILFPCLGNATAAEDALAETFRTAYKKLADFELGEVSVYFWLARIAKNKALDMHRAQKVTGRVLVNFQNLLTPLFENGERPDELLQGAVEEHVLKERIGEVLARLNDRYRQAIELRFLRECSRQDCAVALDVKVATFDVLLLRALRSFRKHWEEVAPTSERPPATAALTP
jgi:RNA polymerase sigma-70 factor (ECF subfamily)